MKLGSPSLEIASRDSHIFSLATTSTFSAFLPGLLANRKMAQRSNRHSLNLIRQTALEAELFNRKRAQRIPSWPGVAHSNQGRIHWRRPFGHLHFLLATGRRTIHWRSLSELFGAIFGSGSCKPELRSSGSSISFSSISAKSRRISPKSHQNKHGAIHSLMPRAK